MLTKTVDREIRVVSTWGERAGVYRNGSKKVNDK